MNKWTKARPSLWACLLAGLLMSLSGMAPAEAILAEDYQMLRSFYKNPGKWPREKQELVKQFASLRKESQPQMIQFYADSEGLVQREYWVANGQMWTFAEANSIRNAIMKNRAAVASGSSGFRDLTFVYADGSKVVYRLARGRVFSIFAVRGDYEPGDLGAMPPGYWQMMRVIRPDD